MDNRQMELLTKLSVHTDNHEEQEYGWQLMQQWVSSVWTLLFPLLMYLYLSYSHWGLPQWINHDPHIFIFWVKAAHSSLCHVAALGF